MTSRRRHANPFRLPGSAPPGRPCDRCCINYEPVTHQPGAWSIQSASSQGWLVVTETTRRAAVPFPLDSGETAAISLALSVKADVLLIDEKRGRAAARSLGLAIGGLLGELLHARQQGWIPRLRDEIGRLRHEAGFFVDAEIEKFILSHAGE